MMAAWRRWMIAALVASAAAFSWGQEESEQPPAGAAGQQAAPQASVDAERLSALQEEVETSELEGPTREGLLARLGEAAERLERAQAARFRAMEQTRLAEEAPAQLERIRQELSQPPVEVRPQPPAGATLEQLEELRARTRADLTAARAEAEALGRQEAERAERRLAIPTELAQAASELEGVEGELATLRAGGVATLDQRVQEAALLAQRAELRAQREALERELASLNARRDLLQARRTRATRRVQQLERSLVAWDDLVGSRRQVEAERAAREAQRLAREAARQHPRLAEVAKENEALAQRLSGENGVSRRIERAREELREMQAALDRLQRQYASIQRRIEISGLDRATGLLLRQQFESIPAPAVLRRQARTQDEDLGEAELARFELQERRDALWNLDERVAAIVAEAERQGLAEDELSSLQAVAFELFEARQELIEQLLSDTTLYRDELINLKDATTRLAVAADAYGSYIRERIMWVRSVEGARIPRVRQVWEAMAWLASPTGWREAWRATARTDGYFWSRAALLAVLVLGLFAVRPWIRRRMGTLAEQVGRAKTDSYALTLRALVLSLVAALPIPSLLWSLAWALSAPSRQEPVALAVAQGLAASAWLLAPLLLLFELLRPVGLGPAHFRWPKPGVRLVRRQLGWFTPTFVVAAFVTATMDAQATAAHNEALGRLAFLVQLAALAVLAERIFRPGGALMGEYLSDHRGGWLDRLRYLWYTLLVGVPLVLIVLTLVGYFYTAVALEARLTWTLLLASGLVLLGALANRWLFIARRRLALEDARRKREQSAAKPVEGTKESGPLATDEERLDLPAISAQTRQLFRSAIFVAAVVGFWLIWASILPALRMFDRVQVWPQVRVLPEAAYVAPVELDPAAGGGAIARERANVEETQEAQGAAPAPLRRGASPPLPGIGQVQGAGRGAGADGAGGEEDLRSVTVADIGLVVVILIATGLAVRNLPALLEIILLQRLPLDSGSRYAVSTVVRYVIGIVGVAIAFNAIGVSWNNVQWLAAALTFGLAFGLQEIFANFMSGLIMLAERPVRVGDTVTVGGVSGTVTRLRMRATSITDWDRKELIIPNKTFITDQVINWSLSDPVLRTTILVGVSYEADVELVDQLLQRIAAEHPVVMKDPAPRVYFQGFGDSTLNFELRCFLPHIEHLIATRHELNHTILRVFREHGVEIAFPQRDLHIRSAEGLAELVRQGLVQKRGLPGSQDGEAS